MAKKKKMTKKGKEMMGKEMKHLMEDKGMSHKQAIAVSLNVLKKKGYKTPKKEGK